MDLASIGAVLGKLDSEVFVLTAADGDRRNGQIVAWVMPATIVPQVPRVLVGVGRMTYTRELLEASRKFALNLLGVDQWRWVPHFGFRSGRDVDKFSGVSFERGRTGSPLLPGIVGYLECQVRSVLDGGGHLFYLADVLEGKLVADRDPLRLHQLFEVLPPEDVATMQQLLEQEIPRHLALL
ncbi:MAG: flavin reductase [candidate division NC10 bacterium]|nr:flavin reductase [candidate division NC10 bacterium]